MNPQQQLPENTSAPSQLNVQEVIGLTARLARLLAEEVDLLSAMKLAKVQELHDEKLFLIASLDGHRKTLAKYPQLSETIPSRDRADLEAVVEVFESILKENHRRLLMAREVNHKIVQAITEVVKDNAMSRVYDGQGATGALGSETVSISLNQTA